MYRSFESACTSSGVRNRVDLAVGGISHSVTQRVLRLLLVVLLFSVTACESTLVVEPYVDGSAADNASIPFYLPQHEFTVLELALDAKGNEVALERRGVQVSLVTRRDLDRAFLVRNETGVFSGSEFAISRDVGGRLTSISGKSDDKTLETVKAITSLVATAAAAAFISGDDYARGALIDERIVLVNVTLPLLLEKLEAAKAAKEIQEIQKAQALARARLVEIKKALAGAAGTKPFGVQQANVEVCTTIDERDKKIKELIQTNQDGVYVFLVPVDKMPEDKPCFQ